METKCSPDFVGF